MPAVNLGDYQLLVVAYTDDGAYLSATRTLRFRQGEAHVEVERRVSQVNTWLDVQLIIRNTGTLDVILYNLQDNLTGFQVLPKTTGDYSVQPSYNHWLDDSRVFIDLYEPGYSAYALHPDHILTIEYRVVPVLKEPVHWRTYTIGAEPMTLSTRVDYDDTILSFVRPAVLPMPDC